MDIEPPADPAARAKYAAAERALDYVEGGMVLGLGTGSTADWLVRLLGARARGLDLLCVPTSAKTARLAAECGLRTATLEAAGRPDLTIDGADEIDPALRLIKGGGGSLLQEKIVAAASRRMLVIADEGKLAPRLGAFPLPVEVVRFGWTATRDLLLRALASEDVGARGARLRGGEAAPFVTDEGHYILDLDLRRIGDPEGLAARLGLLPGVVETGLFLGMASGAAIGRPDGSSRVLEAPDPA